MIAANFNISILCMLPLVIAIVLCFLKTPPAVTLFASGFIAVIVGVIAQKFPFLAGLEVAWSGFDSSILKNENLSGNIISFLNRGGNFSMADSILFMVIAMITMECQG